MSLKPGWIPAKPEEPTETLALLNHRMMIRFCTGNSLLVRSSADHRT